MRIIETKVYKYEELSDSAQEKARDWYRQDGLGYDWWDTCYEDFARFAEILGIGLSQKAVPLMNGKCRYEPEIYFTGFYHQGSGSSFVGKYSYAKGAVAKIKAYAPQDEELHRIAYELQDIQRKHFYRLEARITSRRDAAISVDVYDREDPYKDVGDAESELTDLMNDFNDWMYYRLRDEYEYLTSDEAVAESIVANEYEFDEDGNWV